MDFEAANEETNPTTDNPDIIQPINRDTVHRICSGQVVLSLSVAVKELVENSIDAGAKNIEIRIKDYGMELVEVSDNGVGVRKENFAALALKHYTSKIKEFSDLESICTLGFRGEALSSLCALSNLSITTRHASTEVGTKIEYDFNGKIKSETPIARSIGTTVSLSDLFTPLPVRRKEFVKNHKKEFNKMCTLLYAYCLVAKGVKFKCTNQTSKGSGAATIVSTLGSNSLKDNIISIFTTKQLSTLIEPQLVEPDETILQEYNLKAAVFETFPFKFEILISSVMHGCGRSASDRQFYFVNSRPCEPTKVIKLVNDLYKQYNSHQYPFVYFNITIESNEIDVNVTPDKRQIFMQKEKLLLATIKSTLIGAFKMFPSTYKVQNVDLCKKRVISESSVLESAKKKRKGGELFENNKIEKRQSILDKFAINSGKSASEVKNEIDNEKVEVKDDICIIDSDSDKDNDVVHEETVVACRLDNDDKVVEKINKKEMNDGDVINSGIYKKHRDTVPLNTSIEEIRALLATSLKIKKDTEEINVKFRSQIVPSANKTAEKELQKQISKDMFGKMKIIGQFNLGFILTQLDSDLFIIDQHATDEKYNFEELQRTTVLESQMLVSPKDLQLTSANEAALIDNIDVFKKNGFHFIIDENAEATKKVKLSKIPLSKNYIFGKDDIDEMLYMLQEGCDNTCRPSRVRGMFASRACRKSVMIGRPLKTSDMRQLVDHMGEIDQPWNCPHGRPTMRHLINLQLLQND